MVEDNRTTGGNDLKEDIRKEIKAVDDKFDLYVKDSTFKFVLAGAFGLPILLFGYVLTVYSAQSTRMDNMTNQLQQAQVAAATDKAVIEQQAKELDALRINKYRQ